MACLVAVAIIAILILVLWIINAVFGPVWAALFIIAIVILGHSNMPPNRYY